jgi:hypothetical protein
VGTAVGRPGGVGTGAIGRQASVGTAALGRSGSAATVVSTGTATNPNPKTTQRKPPTGEFPETSRSSSSA